MIITSVLLGACTQEVEQIKSLSQLNEEGMVIAVATDTPEAKLVTEDFSNAEIRYYSDIIPAYNEVASGKIHAEPYTFYVGNKLAGVDIELAKRFALWLGACLKFKVYDWGGLLSATQSGDADCIMSNLFYMPEYEETPGFPTIC